MSIRVTFAGASLIKPGSYSIVEPTEGGIASPALGVVALIGEASSGQPFSQETGLDAVTYGPDEFSAILDKFGSGELVDAARLAITPSNDPQISGGAQQLILIKTNASTLASKTIKQGANTYGTLNAKRWGQAGNQVSAAIAITASKAVVTLNDLARGITEVSAALGGNAVLTLLCTDSSATAATVTIDALNFKTTITGGTAQNLNVPLANFNTVAKLASYINAHTGYTATVSSSAAGNLPIAALDRVTAASISTTALAINKDAFEMQDFFAKSVLVTFTPDATHGYVGLPTLNVKAFLSGGSLGGTAQADVQSALDSLLKRRVNFVVPLFSRDATDDQLENLTDASSSYTIDSIHAAASSHCDEASTVKGRKERQAFVAYKGTFADTSEKAATLSAARVQMLFQDVTIVAASTGLATSKLPHMLAVISAGMKASAPVGLPNTFKQPHILGFAHTEFDAETQYEQALSDNLCFVERAPTGGFRFVLDNSTYSLDENAWIYNRPSVLYASDVLAYLIRINTEQFVGKRNSDVSEEGIKNLLIGVMDSAKSAGIIVSDTNTQGRGYKDLKVKIMGSIVTIDVTCALVEGLEFILSSIKVQRAA
jgi:hypothetical protein